MSKFKNVLILVAMEVETKTIVRKLNLDPVACNFDSDLPLKAYQSTDTFPIKLTLVYSGKCRTFKVDRIGKEAAAIMAWESIRIFSPDLIISAGTAGGFKHKGATIGDVYISNMIHHHDRLYHPVKEFIGYGVGAYASHNLQDLATQLGMKSGNVSTGNSLIPSQPETEQMIKNDAALKEMEAAAIAEVASLKNTPMIAIKSITDFVDSDSSPDEQFLKNYKIALQNLSEKLELFIRVLANQNDSLTSH